MDNVTTSPRFGHRLRPLLLAAVFLSPLLFFALFYFYPLAAILRLGLWSEGRLDTAALGELFRSAYFLRVLWFTVWQAVVSTLLTLALALPGAYVLARFRFRGQTLIRAVATLPFVLPTVVVAAAFVALVGPTGVLNVWLMRLLALDAPPIRLSQTVWIILLAHVFYNYSVALRLLSAYWQNLPPSLSQAAQMLGASPARAFLTVTLPLLRPALLAAAALVFTFTFTSFGVIVVLGGPHFATLEVEIYRQAVNLFNLPVAAALSLWQILFTFILMAGYTRTQLRVTRALRLGARRAIERPVRPPRERLLVAGNAANGYRHAVKKFGQCVAETAAGVAHIGQHGGGYVQFGKQFFVPFQRVNIVQHGARGVAVIGGVYGSAGKFVNKPGIYGSEKQMSFFGFLSGIGYIV